MSDKNKTNSNQYLLSDSNTIKQSPTLVCEFKFKFNLHIINIILVKLKYILNGLHIIPPLYDLCIDWSCCVIVLRKIDFKKPLCNCFTVIDCFSTKSSQVMYL